MTLRSFNTKGLFLNNLAHTKCTNSRWQRRKEDRPSEILNAALKTFSIKGFSSTKLEDVAKIAGVSKATLYLYFESKEALFKAVVTEFVLPHILKAEQQAQDHTGRVKDLIYELVEHWRCNILETPLSGISKIMIAEASNFPELSHFYLEHVIKRSRKFVVRLIEVGIKNGEFKECSAQDVARSLINTIIFTAVWKYSLERYDEPYDVKHYINSHLEIFFRGIEKGCQG